jgi:hypothetical protein
MSPHEPMPRLIEPQDFDDDEYSYLSQKNPDTDSSDAGFTSDSDCASNIRKVGESPGSPKLASEDAGYSSEEERNAAIDAQAALLRKRDYQSTLQAPDRCGESTAIRTHFRYPDVERSPISSFTEQRRGSQPLQRSAFSNHGRLREQYYQRYSREKARQRTFEKPARRVTMPRTSAQTQLPRDTGSVTDVENSDQEPFIRSTVIIPWGPHSNINRDIQGITEHGLGITMDHGSEIAEGSNRQPTHSETLGCEYRVW